MELTSEIIFSIIQSEKEFSVDFDDAIEWWDCKTKQGKPVRKDNLVRKLTTDYYKDVDYHLLKNEEMVERPQGGGLSADKYYLTLECFKMMGMQVSGSRGREIREYFLKCEAELKCRLELERQQNAQCSKKQLVAAMVSEDVVSRKSKFSDEFYKMLYRKRGRGWETRDPKKFRPPCVGTWTNQTVYDRMLGGTEPGGVKDTLDKVNPRRENGTRKDRHHWHLKELGEFHLNTHLYALMAIANTVRDGDWDRFIEKIDQAFPNDEALQLTLWDILEEMENNLSSLQGLA